MLRGKIQGLQYHLGRNPLTGLAFLGPAAPLVCPDFLEKHLYWPETQLCLPRMLLA